MDKNTAIVLVSLFVALTIAQAIDSIAKAWAQRGNCGRHREDC